VIPEDRPSSETETDPWLVRAGSIRKLWIGFAVLLAATVLAQALLPVKGYFGVDSWFGFAAVFGFLSCVALVIVARILGTLLKRDERYYDD